MRVVQEPYVDGPVDNCKDDFLYTCVSLPNRMVFTRLISIIAALAGWQN